MLAAVGGETGHWPPAAGHDAPAQLPAHSAPPAGRPRGAAREAADVGDEPLADQQHLHRGRVAGGQQPNQAGASQAVGTSLGDGDGAEAGQVDGDLIAVLLGDGDPGRGGIAGIPRRPGTRGPGGGPAGCCPTASAAGWVARAAAKASSRAVSPIPRPAARSDGAGATAAGGAVGGAARPPPAPRRSQPPARSRPSTPRAARQCRGARRAGCRGARRSCWPGPARATARPAVVAAPGGRLLVQDQKEQAWAWRAAGRRGRAVGAAVASRARSIRHHAAAGRRASCGRGWRRRSPASGGRHQAHVRRSATANRPPAPHTAGPRWVGIPDPRPGTHLHLVG